MQSLSCNRENCCYFAYALKGIVFGSLKGCCWCSVTKSCLTLPLHGLQDARLLCPPISPGVCLNSCPLKMWCYVTISSSAIPFSFCLQSIPASGSFPMIWFFIKGDQSIGASCHPKYTNSSYSLMSENSNPIKTWGKGLAWWSRG